MNGEVVGQLVDFRLLEIHAVPPLSGRVLLNVAFKGQLDALSHVVHVVGGAVNVTRQPEYLFAALTHWLLWVLLVLQGSDQLDAE